jgi:hypothetical protein
LDIAKKELAAERVIKQAVEEALLQLQASFNLLQVEP